MNALLEHLQKEYVPTYTKEDGEPEVCIKVVIISATLNISVQTIVYQKNELLQNISTVLQIYKC